MAFLGETTLTRRRYAAPTYTAGRPVAGVSADTSFLGSVQPMPERDRQVLPEGVRHRDARKVYCGQGTLRVDDQHGGTPADQVITPDALVFTVVHVDSSHPLIEHDRAYMIRLQEVEPPPVEEEEP